MAFDLGDMTGKIQAAEALPAIWSDVQGKDWNDLIHRVEAAKQSYDGNPAELSNVHAATKKAAASGEPFPQSLQDLAGLIRKHQS